jgi:hypothetical protein
MQTVKQTQQGMERQQISAELLWPGHQQMVITVLREREEIASWAAGGGRGGGGGGVLQGSVPAMRHQEKLTIFM